MQVSMLSPRRGRPGKGGEFEFLAPKMFKCPKMGHKNPIK
jgi:hypothetical protein